MLIRKSASEAMRSMYAQPALEPTPVRTPLQLADWIDRSPPGAKALYHVGDLANEREGLLMFPNGKVAPVTKEPLNSLANAVWDAYASGHVFLVQERRPNKTLAYLAVRSKRRPFVGRRMARAK